MPIDPNIILQAGAVKPLDYGELAGRALNQIGQQQQIAYQRDQMAANQRATAAAERKQTTLGEVGKLAAGGDTAGARKAALGAGDFDLLKQLDAMDETGVKRLKTIAANTAPIIAQLGKIPPGPARAAAFQQAAPFLAQNGYDASHIEQLGGQINDDNFINLAISNAMTIGEYNSQANADRTFTAGRDDQAYARGKDTRDFTYRAGNDAANRGLTMRGQNMADARAATAAGVTKQKLDRIPTSAAFGILGNATAINKVDAALEALNGRPKSVGVGTGALGTTFTNLNDPDGTAVRAAIAEIGAVKIHDLSGAAVSASEAPRFTPFVPTITDPPAVIRAKLAKFRQLLQEDLKQQKAYYSPANGFKPPAGIDVPATAPSATTGGSWSVSVVKK